MISRRKERVFLVTSILLYVIMSSCSDQPRREPDTQNLNDNLLKAKKSEYIPVTDITVQLRNDLNAGLDVKLPAGHFYVSESIIIQNYSGTLEGAGKDVTILEAAQGFQAIYNPYLGAMYGDNDVAEIFSFQWSKGDVTFKNMTLLVTGESPAVIHNNPMHGNLTTIDNAIVVSAAHPEAENGITVTFKNLKIKGEVSNDSLSFNGKNLIYPLIANGWRGDNPVNVVIMNCEIENSGKDAMEYYAGIGGSVEMKNNKISNCFGGIWLGWYLSMSEVSVKNNRFVNINGYPPILRDSSVSNYCFKNNTLDGTPLPDDCQ